MTGNGTQNQAIYSRAQVQAGTDLSRAESAIRAALVQEPNHIL